MNTIWSRINSLFAFTLSVLAGLTFLCFLSTAFYEYKGGVQISTGRTMVKVVSDFSAARQKTDLGHITFDLQANLSHLFDWNVKQLFLYLTAKYSTDTNVVNHVVLWDKIIKRGEDPVLNLKNMNTKYYFWDDGNGLRGNDNVSLILSWNVIPNSGRLLNIDADGVHVFSFPKNYTVSKI